MLRSLTRRPTARRRGAVLIVVLAMLVLFAVLGLSFVLYSEAQLTAAKNNLEAKNQEADPDPTAAAQFFTGAFVYGTDDEGAPLRGQSLAEGKYGWDYGGTVAGYYVPFAGYPVGDFTPVNVTDQTPATNPWNLTGVMEKDVVNYTRINTGNPGEFLIFDPMRGDGSMIRTQTNPQFTSPGYTRKFFNRAAPGTYPDRSTNFFLAYQDPSTGAIVLPSFHRPDLFTNTDTLTYPNPADQIAQSLNPNNPRWTDATSRLRTLRPRKAEHPHFPDVPMNADGSYTGDVCNLKFTAGTQKNDSLWMYTGGPVMKWRGKNYVACVAPLVLDLSGRVNLSIAGNAKQGQTATGNDGTTGGSQGFGPWEIDLSTVVGSSADALKIIARRQGNTAAPYNPPADPYTNAAYTTRINGRKLPSIYSLFDFDGDSSRPVPGVGTSDCFTLPAGTGYSSFPQYLLAAPPATAQRYAYDPATTVGETSNHGSQFNPLLLARIGGYTSAPGSAGGFGHDDLIRMTTRYSDPKGRTTATTSVPTGVAGLTPAADTTLAQTLRALTTTFSVRQQWAATYPGFVKATPAVTVTGTTITPGAISDFRLGPVDLNRTLPDYRQNPALPYSPLNIWPAGSPNYEAARTARQRLARDIFIRLAGVYGFIDGTAAVYVTSTGNVVILDPTNVKVQSMAPLAQFAANLVDYIDNDDISTAFVWNPTAAAVKNSPLDPSLDPTNFDPAEITKRVVFGTELPRLVINEAYCGVFNERGEEATAPAGNKSTKPLKRRYWVELHNPTPAEAANSAARSDGGAARLQYQQGVTPLPDPATGIPAAYPGTTYNPYRLDIAEVPAPAAGVALPYSAVLGLAQFSGVDALDPTNALFTGMTVKLRVNKFTPTAATPPGPNLALTGDAVNVVLPATAAADATKSNVGYYLLGGQDQFPSKDVTNSLSLDDPPANPTYPVNAMAYDTTAGAPADADITTERGKSSVVLLRRLVNPYLLPQEDPTKANFNPYITVDYLENVPTRDRAKYSSAGAHAKDASYDFPTVGRIHPYAAAPAYGTANPAAGQEAVRDQTSAAATPPSPVHSFFAINSPADNNRTIGTATVGFEWLVHLDRELVSLPEAAHVSRVSPANLTQTFCAGGALGAVQYQGHAVRLDNVYFSDTLGLLETGPRLPGVPLGGREPGRVNLNTVNATEALTALIGPNNGTNFIVTDPGIYGAVQNGLFPPTPPAANGVARTPNKVPRATAAESGTLNSGTQTGWDNPFIYGSGLWTGANPLTRSTTDPKSGAPLFSNPNALHPYFQTEPVRKLWNNITPTSDSFLVVMTVGFFEVENPGPWDKTNQPVLGKELFDKVPGDLRAQFAGVIDRSCLAVADPTTSTTPAAPSVAPAPPFQTRLVADVLPGDTTITVEADPTNKGLLSDGIYLSFSPNQKLRVGYGDASTASGNGEWVTIDGTATSPGPGLVKLTLATGTSVSLGHAAGELVSDVLFGNPGPQKGVTFKQLRDRGLVPYFTRLEP